jgi:hypothetical protein
MVYIFSLNGMLIQKRSYVISPCFSFVIFDISKISVYINIHTDNLKISPNTPLAVTDAPAPAP